MSLSGAQFQELQQALLSAFPSLTALAQMVRFQLNENLDAIVGGSNLSDTAFKLVEWAEAQGRTEELINGARTANPGNAALKNLSFGPSKAPSQDAAPAAQGRRDDVAGGTVMGDKIMGDKVGGDKVEGDKISIGDISGSSGVAIGTGAQVNITHNYGTSDTSDPTSNQPPSTSPSTPEVFISYAWGGESEAIVDQLDAAFQAKGITILRDKREVGFKDRIRDFMRRIGQGHAVVVIISQKYLQSENCMFELLEVANHGEFIDRVFPIVLSDADIYDPLTRINYVSYWEEKIEKLDKAIRSVSSANLQGFRESIDLYTEIRGSIATLTDTLADMNALTPDMHRDSDFSIIIDAVSEKLDKG